MNRSSGRDGDSLDDPETGLAGYRKRGSSLPANCSSISVRLLPSLRHSSTEPDIWKHKTIPEGVIETDYLVQPDSMEEFPSPGEKSETKDNTIGKELKLSQTVFRPTERDSNPSQPEVCRELQKAFLDGLRQRVISRRGRSEDERSTYDLLLNSDLLDRVSLDIILMSEREPSGLNGCRLRTRIERQDSADMDLGCVRIDQDTEETFEIVLSLKEEECQKTSGKRPPGLIGNLSSLLSNLLRPTQLQPRGRTHAVEVRVSDAYQLEKIKLQKFSDSRPNSSISLCKA